jgi:hypothetical protein
MGGSDKSRAGLFPALRLDTLSNGGGASLHTDA